MTRTRHLFFIFLCAACGLLLFAPSGARAATIQVTSNADSGPGSLRAAITTADSDGGDDAITFSGVTSITLTSGQLNITAPMTIDGPGVTVSGGGNSNVFTITGGTVAMIGLTITGGNGFNSASGNGGGINLSSGTVTLTGCTITGNTASNGGGIANEGGGALTLTDCTLTGNHGDSGGDGGGGILNGSGSLTLTGCTLTGNTAYNGDGGGVLLSGGTATLTDCALSGNGTTNGGGVSNEGGALTLTDCALSSNNTDGGGDGGGINTYSGSTTVIGCTLTDNSSPSPGGGIANQGGSTTLDDDIVYGDSASTDPEVYISSGSVSAAYCDIDQSGYAGTNNNIDAGPGFVNSPSNLSLTAGSPCIGAGDPALAGTKDITGAIRFNPPTIGAYEGYSLVVTNANASGAGSLSEAVTTANNSPDAVITFDPADFTSAETITPGQTLTLSKSAEIIGPASGVSVSGGNSQEVFDVGYSPSAITAILTSLTITDGTSGDSGEGGGLFNEGGRATLTDCTFTGNSGGSSNYGGGLYNQYGTVTLTDCIFSDNNAGTGGGIFNEGTVTLTSCTFAGNSASFGGGLYNDGGAVTLDNDILYGNTASSGNEIYNSGGNATATYCDIDQSGYTGTGDIDADPLFVGSPANLRLRPGSPCVGAGDPALAGTPDITGAIRPDPPTIGAYEGTAAASQVMLQSNHNPSVYGQSVTFTATVNNTSPGSRAVPTGSAEFFVDGSMTPAATVGLNGNQQATFTTAVLSAGPHTVVATFVPAASNFQGSSENLNQRVNPANTTTMLNGTPNPSTAGQSVFLTVTVTANAPSEGTPFGNVEFFLGNAATPFATASLDSSGETATPAPSFTASGTVTINAVYEGDANFNGSQNFVRQTVNPGAATHFQVSAPASVSAGAPFSVTVTALDAYGNKATGYTGTIHFTSTDAQAALPADYTFVSGDAGRHVFTNGVTLTTPGQQTVTVTDTTNSSVTGGSSAITVIGSPTANAQSVSTNENTATNITLTGTDPDNPPLALTYAIASQPTHGSLGTLNASTGAVTYTPTAGYSGSDSFTFTVSNGTNTSTAATVSITVTQTGTSTVVTSSKNPSAVGQGVTFTATVTNTTQGSMATPTGTVTFFINGSPATGGGNIALSNGKAAFTTSFSALGSYMITAAYKSSNGLADSDNTGSPLTQNVVGAPTANAQSVAVAHDSSGTAITLTGSDPNSPPETLTYITSSSPAHGTLSGFNASTGAVTYTPDAGYYGTDSFKFKVTNSSGLTSSVATVTLNVAVGTPTANSQSVSVNAGSSVGITLTGSDDDNPALSLTYNVGSPSHGMLSGTAPNLTYTPTAGYVGSDSFTFTVSNGTNTSAAATVSITVNPYGAATKIAVSGPANATAGQAAAFTFTVEDQYGNTVGNYSGTATLTTTDPRASVPASVTFTNGAAHASVTFTTAGTQSLTATSASGLASGTLRPITVSSSTTAAAQVTVGTVALSASGSTVTAKVTLTNIGYGTASSVTVTAGRLGTVLSPLPPGVGTLAAGQSATVTLTFANAPTGTQLLLVSGSYQSPVGAGAFTSSQRVSAP